MSELLGTIQPILRKHRARLTSGYRPGARTNAGTQSRHANAGAAYDVQIPGGTSEQHEALREDLEAAGAYALVETPGSKWAGKGNKATIVHIQASAPAPRPGETTERVNQLAAGWLEQARAKQSSAVSGSGWLESARKELPAHILRLVPLTKIQ